MGLFCDARFILQYHRTDSWQCLAFLQTLITNTQTLLNFSSNDLKEEKMFFSVRRTDASGMYVSLSLVSCSFVTLTTKNQR